MPAADSSGSDDAPKYRSPKRTLAHSFRLSRDRWKTKAAQRRAQLRALKVRLRDVEASRDLWKTKALHLQEQLQHLSAAAAAPLSQQPGGAEPILPAPAGAPTPHATDLDPAPPVPGHAVDPPPAASTQQAFKKKRRR
jgi:hypothetical protein